MDPVNDDDDDDDDDLGFRDPVKQSGELTAFAMFIPRFLRKQYNECIWYRKHGVKKVGAFCTYDGRPAETILYTPFT